MIVSLDRVGCIVHLIIYLVMILFCGRESLAPKSSSSSSPLVGGLQVCSSSCAAEKMRRVPRCWSFQSGEAYSDTEAYPLGTLVRDSWPIHERATPPLARSPPMSSLLFIAFIRRRDRRHCWWQSHSASSLEESKGTRHESIALPQGRSHLLSAHR